MTTSDFYMIYIQKNPGVSYANVKKEMNRGLSWYRFNETTWVVHTTSNSDKWYARLSPLVKKGGNVFICKLEIDERQGWMKKAFWKWLREQAE